MWSLTNSFKRLALFLRQKLDEISAQKKSEEEERQKRESKKEDNTDSFNKYVLYTILYIYQTLITFILMRFIFSLYHKFG
jgi:hypothetical protein